MPIDLQGGKPFFGDMPDLRAAPIGDLMSAILKDRLLREEQLRKTMTDTIKNAQAYRQQNAYADAAKKAGLFGDLEDTEGLGPYSKTLADQIQEKKDQESLKTYREALAKGNNGGRGGDGSYPTAGDNPEETVVNGIRYYKQYYGVHGQYKWMPLGPSLQPETSRQPSVKDSYQIEKELRDAALWHEQMSESERKRNAELNPNVPHSNIPYSRADDYNKIIKDMKELQERRANPQPGADENIQGPQVQTTRPPGSGTGGIDPEDIRILLENPTPRRIRQFESHYWPGAASPYLNQPGASPTPSPTPP